MNHVSRAVIVIVILLLIIITLTLELELKLGTHWLNYLCVLNCGCGIVEKQ